MGIPNRNTISALTAGNGAVIDVPRGKFEGTGADLIEKGFEKVEQGLKHGVRMEIVKLLSGGDRLLLNVESNGERRNVEIKRTDMNIGGNAVNTAIAIAEVTKLMEETNESGVRIYGPLSNIMHELMEERVSHLLPIKNTLSNDKDRGTMPSRLNAVDQRKELYVGSRPDFTGRMETDLQFLKNEGILMPMNNGDLLLSSCINSPIFWKQIEKYLHENPNATLYFQPGSVHMGKLASEAAYLPRHLLDAGRITILLNLNEVTGFHDHLESNGIHERITVNIPCLSLCERLADNIDPEVREKLIKIVYMLNSLGLKDFTITSGPGEIVSYSKCHENRDNIYVTQPESRDMGQAFLQSIGIEESSEKVLSTGCGDTFTGAFIGLSRLYPEIDRLFLLEAASLFAAVQTHNPGSNLSNLKLKALRKMVLKKLEGGSIKGNIAA